MSVYVDDMNAEFGRMKMSHMIADTEEELHQMAYRIGVARKWYQGDHYDIALSKKLLAVQLGAKAITWRDLSFMMALRHRDPKAPLVTPEDGERIVRGRIDARRKARLQATEGETEEAAS